MKVREQQTPTRKLLHHSELDELMHGRFLSAKKALKHYNIHLLSVTAIRNKQPQRSQPSRVPVPLVPRE